MNAADRLRSKKPRQVTVGIHLDDTRTDALDQAALDLREAQQNAPADDVVRALREAVQAAQGASDEATLWLTFRSIPRTQFAALLAAHPPTVQQTERAETLGLGRPDFDPETFGPQVLAASCVAPTLSLEDWLEVYASDAWNSAELAALVAAAVGVNTRTRPLLTEPPKD